MIYAAMHAFHKSLPYSQLFTRVAAFADAFNLPRAGYFHCCIIHGIKPHER